MNTQHKLLSSCPVSCFADEIAESLDRQIEVLSRLGISYVELRSADGINVSDFTMNFAKEVKKNSIRQISAFPPSALRSAKSELTMISMRTCRSFSHTEQMADIFETPYIRMFSFYIPENYAAADCRSEVLFRTEAMVAEAAHNNITLLHENEKGIYGDNASRCLDLMQQFAGKHFSCTFDFANFIQCGQDPSEAYEMLSPIFPMSTSRTRSLLPAKSFRQAQATDISRKFSKSSTLPAITAFEPRAAFSQFQRSCSVRTQRCDSHRKQHGKGVLRCLGGIPEGAGITSKSCPYGSSFSWHLISQN